MSLVALTGRDPDASDRPGDRGNGEQPSIGQSRWVYFDIPAAVGTSLLVIAINSAAALISRFGGWER